MEDVEVKFNPRAAKKYAKEKGIQLPKKASDGVLAEIIREWIDENTGEEPYQCEHCEENVCDDDVICWFCGADVSEVADDDSAIGESGEPTKAAAPESGGAEGDEPEEPEDAEGEDDEPKKEAEGDTEEEEKKPAKDKKELAKPKRREVAPLKNLEEYTTKIRKLNYSQGEAAWRIGHYLLQIKEGEVFREGGYDSLADYVTAELSYTWQAARNYMRYAQLVDKEHAAMLGVYKLEVLSRTPEESRDKVLKAALPEDAGGKGMSCRQLEEVLKKEKAKAKKKHGKVKGDGRGRKPEPNKHIRLHDLIERGEELKVPVEDGVGSMLIPDSRCVVEVKVLKKSVKVAFFLAEDEE